MASLEVVRLCVNQGGTASGVEELVSREYFRGSLLRTPRACIAGMGLVDLTLDCGSVLSYHIYKWS